MYLRILMLKQCKTAILLEINAKTLVMSILNPAQCWGQGTTTLPQDLGRGSGGGGVGPYF